MMRHDIHMTGSMCNLCPVSLEDASFINDLRSDPEKSRYIHSVSGKIEDQQAWIENYFEREGDYYFVIEREKNRKPEGTIGIYDLDPVQKTAEWGRWILSNESILAVESVLLLYRVVFEELKLESVFCRTLTDNEKVVSFNDSCGIPRSGLLENYHVIDGVSYDAVEHRLTRAEWPRVREKLSRIVQRMAEYFAA